MTGTYLHTCKYESLYLIIYLLNNLSIYAFCLSFAISLRLHIKG